jgi:streptogramin lyase
MVVGIETRRFDVRRVDVHVHVHGGDREYCTHGDELDNKRERLRVVHRTRAAPSARECDGRYGEHWTKTPAANEYVYVHVYENTYI